ncbi:MAG: class I SAM-dependent methyltransferase [Acidimicrobiales bacterium]
METAEYDRMAAMGERHWWYAATRAELADLIVPHLAQGGRFLDAGGGTGATGAWLTRYGSLVALDPVLGAVAHYAAAYPGTLGVVGDLNRLPLADACVDLALCVTVLCHTAIPDPQRAVDELARVVRPGGLVCLWEPGVRRLRRAHDRVTHTARRFSRADLRTLAHGAGLEVIRATGTHSYLVPAAAAKAVLERGRTSSDLDRADDGLRGVLPALAGLERRLLRRVSLPFGLSVAVVARRPSA